MQTHSTISKPVLFSDAGALEWSAWAYAVDLEVLKQEATRAVGTRNFYQRLFEMRLFVDMLGDHTTMATQYCKVVVCADTLEHVWMARTFMTLESASVDQSKPRHHGEMDPPHRTIRQMSS